MRIAAVVGAVVFLAALSACAGPAPAPPPPPNPYLPAAGKVAQLQSPADMMLVDGRRIHVTMLQGSPTKDSCELKADLKLAHSMLDSTTVTITKAAHTDTPTAVPAGALQVDLRTGDGRDYSTAYDPKRYENRQAMCAPAPEPAETSAPTSPEPSTSSRVDVDVDRDHNMPDGALTGGYCAHKWWC